MRGVEFLKNTIAFTHRACADATNGTDEQVHFVPEHGSHSIAWCLWHAARVENIVNKERGRKAPEVWSEQWASRPGLPFEGMGTSMSDREAQVIHIADRDAFREHQNAVWKQTEELLNSITDEDPERLITTRDGGTETLGEGISLHMVGHFNGHRGEINILRGMQGMPTVLLVKGTH